MVRSLKRHERRALMRSLVTNRQKTAVMKCRLDTEPQTAAAFA
ncbi:putative phage DNA replication domain protein [Escherichia coli 178850]|nr:putative phage DNA replication domain protein [Escherichia coli 178850]